MARTTVRTKVQIVIEVTPHQARQLALEYGIATDPASIREFVRSYVTEYVEREGSPAAAFWTVVA